MVELLTVVAVIGILAAAAAPSFVRLLRDRRVTDAAQQMADMYRVARARAMGRGSATMVRWDDAHAMPSTADPEGHLTLREAVLGVGLGAMLPSTSCLGTDWSTAGATSKFVASFDERRKRFEPAVAAMQDADGTPLPYLEICFTPRGRTFWRTANQGEFAAMNAVPRIEVVNTRTGMKRYVILPPTGAARLVTEI